MYVYCYMVATFIDKLGQEAGLCASCMILSNLHKMLIDQMMSFHLINCVNSDNQRCN